MTDAPAEKEVEARVRRRRWFAWVWAVPIVAGGIVIWLSWRALSDRGPAITIVFKAAEGLQAGQTKIQHRDVDVGTVEAVELTPDMSRVIVHARMTRAAAPYLNEKTSFYIVSPHVGVGGISGLSTIVSGTYIEMSPGRDGQAQRRFVALDEAPILAPDARGTSFTLEAPDLGSLTRGSPISYQGVLVGEVEGYMLATDGSHVTVTAFMRSPWDNLVHPETRFWNAGGVDCRWVRRVCACRANSWQQLFSGGIAFETSTTVLAKPPSPADADFPLYDNRQRLARAARPRDSLCGRNSRAISAASSPAFPWRCEGVEVGEVKESSSADLTSVVTNS